MVPSTCFVFKVVPLEQLYYLYFYYCGRGTG
jgi:hypothetical protein